jgi:hypothetical protein
MKNFYGFVSIGIRNIALVLSTATIFYFIIVTLYCIGSTIDEKVLIFDYNINRHWMAAVLSLAIAINLKS